MKVFSYHIEYDLPIDHDKDETEIVKTLAGYIEYIMDDIIHDLGMEKYKLQFYYMVNHVILDMIIKMEQRENEAKYVKNDENIILEVTKDEDGL